MKADAEDIFTSDFTKNVFAKGQKLSTMVWNYGHTWEEVQNSDIT